MKKERLRLNRRLIRYLGLIIAVSLGSCSRLPVKNYYIPQDFNGNVAIIYTASLKEKSKSRYDYYIPENGLLYHNTNFETGNFIVNFYQKNENGKLDTLLEELPGRKFDSAKNRIYFRRVLTFKKNPNSINVVTFYVGKQQASQINKERFLFERKLEEIVRSSL